MGSKAHYITPIQVFERLVLILLLVHVMDWFPARELIWSKQSPLMPVYMESGLLNNFVLRLSYVRSSADFVIWTHIIAVVLAFVPLIGRLFKGLAYLSGLMLFFGAPTLFGNEFMWLLNFLLILIITSRNANRNKLEIHLSNLAFIGVSAIALIHFVFWGISFFLQFDLYTENSWAMAAMDAPGAGNFIRRFFEGGFVDLNPIRFALFLVLPLALLKRKIAVPVLIASFLLELLWIVNSGLYLEGCTVLIVQVFFFLTIYPRKISL